LETKDHKKNKIVGVTISDFKFYDRAIAIKTAWYWHENKWNRRGDSDMNPHNYAHPIFDKCAKNIQWRKDTSSTNGAW
jgi:hypothetical protein